MMIFPSRRFHLVGHRAIFAPSSGGGPLVPVQDREQEIHVSDEEQEGRHRVVPNQYSTWRFC